jgi:hypothetical protein
MTALLALLACASFVFALAPAPLKAADHSEAPIADENRPEDIGDVYAFVDPNDQTKIVIAFTVVGFIVPAEQLNQGSFAPDARYRIELEETGDAMPDRFIDITFSARASSTSPQTATITLPNGRTFTAPTTPPSFQSVAPTPVVTTDQTSGASFFAGIVDDPFFFDIPASTRFIASVLAGSPNPGEFDRGRDSFAGYNTLGAAISIPTAMLNFTNDTIGVDMMAQLPKNRQFKKNRDGFVYKGPFQTIDRMGNPAINTALIPFARKDEYNFATTKDDAAGVFANDIVATLTALGTNAENIGILASVAVTNGDFLRLNTSAAPGFPNGRRLEDDVIDTILFFIANQNKLGDNVNANDVPLPGSFPFFARSQQPRAPGMVDDNTRN